MKNILPTDTSIFMKSFNEDVVVEFDEVSHSYTFKGKTLLSGSKYAEDNDFDKERVAGYCSRAWGVKFADVLSLWESNANVSADFGTVIHAMLEHFNKYSKILPMKEIERAKPRHPFLRKILDDYIDVVGITNIEPEVFVTYIEDGFCGQVDGIEILDKKKKIINVWDYKINALKSKQDPTGKKKLAKYQKQLSFYAHILEKTGWTVKEIGAIVLEDSWSVYKFDKLNI